MSPAARTADLRRQVLVATAALGGVYLVVFGPGVVLAVRTLAGGAPPSAAVGWQDRVAALEWDVFVVAVVLLVVVRWLPRHAPEVGRRLALGRPHRRVPGGLPGAAAVFVAVALLSGTLGDRIVAAAHLTGGHDTQVGEGTGGFVLGVAASLSAGITEEITLVALAVAVVSLTTGRSWTAPVTLATMLVLRLLPHLYYGWTSVFVVFWTVGVYALFRWAGSVWPLVVGHVVYDVLSLGGHTYPQLSRVFGVALCAVAVAGCAVVGLAVLARSRGRSLAFSGG